MNLELTRPLVVLDLETTGLNEPVRIIQLAAIKYMPDGSTEERCKLVNPGRPIEPEAVAVHGITDEMVAQEKPFSAYGQSIAGFLSGCDLCGFNIVGYDLRVLKREFELANVDFDASASHVIDAQRVYFRFFPRNLAAAYQEYCGGTLEQAHDALADAKATAEILFRQIERHELPREPAEIEKMIGGADAAGGRGSSRPFGGKLSVQDDEVYINFGKHSGKSLKWMAENERGYLDWILNKDFADEVKDEIRKHLA